MLLLITFLLIHEIDSKNANNEIGHCLIPECDEKEVCGLRTDGLGYRLKLFKSECDLYKVNCDLKEDFAYKVVSMYYCESSFKMESTTESITPTDMPCVESDCPYPSDSQTVCGIMKEGERYRVRLFENKCQLEKFNCETKLDFNETDLHICNSVEVTELNDNSIENGDYENLIILNNSTVDPTNSFTEKNRDSEADIKNIIVVRSSISDFININESVNTFFAATHVFDLPVKEIDRSYLNMSTRRRHVNIVRPVKVFVPWITIPKNISDDNDHMPTLSSCYHKCPRKCPDTYAPVCGVPGIVAREPSLMFQNHCFMDVAQCKMYWEQKSPTSLSSSYVESSFLFCLGDEMNGMYRFLPLIKTLQHMGRLRKKGRFHYRFHNMKFFNNLLSRQPKFMG